MAKEHGHAHAHEHETHGHGHETHEGEEKDKPKKKNDKSEKATLEVREIPVSADPPTSLWGIADENGVITFGAPGQQPAALIFRRKEYAEALMGVLGG